MLIFLYVILLGILLFQYSSSSKYFMKPSFPNYCDSKAKCKPACNCELYPNCSLLSMDETVRKTILFYHNQIRDIQSAGDPQPSGMPMLQYDMQLEEISKCWAARCDNEYSVCFKSPRFRETSQSVGGLILEGEESPNVFLWLQMMSYWLGQAEVVSAKAIHSLPADQKHESMHNFAQLMSDTVLSVGCAWSILTTDNWLIFVCTYGPRGPLEGESIYRTGYPCSHCPEDYACDYVKPFERLCKPSTEIPKPPASFSPPKKEPEQQRHEEQGYSISSNDQMPPHHQGSNRTLNEQPTSVLFTNPTVSYPVHKTEILPEQSTAPTLPQLPPEYKVQEFSQPPAIPPMPHRPTFHQDVPPPPVPAPPLLPVPPLLTSSAPQQFLQYIPQPPPLPRIPKPFFQPADPYMPHYPPYPPPYPPPPQFQPPLSLPPPQFQPPPSIPPPPQEMYDQDFYQSRQRPPIIPPPPTERTFDTQPHYEQDVSSYRFLSEYGPIRGYSNISPPIPQPPFIDQPSPYFPRPEASMNNPPPNYDNRRSYYPGLSPYFRSEVGMQTSSSVPQPPPQIPSPQSPQTIILPHAEPLPPPMSYFPPQPPPLPRESSETNDNVPPPVPRAPTLQQPPIPPPPMQDTPQARKKPEATQYSYSVLPYDSSSNPNSVSQTPFFYPLPPSRSDINARGRRKKESNYTHGLFQKSSISVIILSGVFVLAFM